MVKLFIGAMISLARILSERSIIMNELLEAKLTISCIRTQLLDLAGELIADDLSTKEYAIKRILTVIDTLMNTI